MPKIKIYIDAEGVEHRVGPNSESKFLKDYNGAKFLREEYIFGQDDNLNKMYNSEDFELNSTLKVNKNKEEEEETPAGVWYEYRNNSTYGSGWFRNTNDVSPLDTDVQPVLEKDVPDKDYNAYIADLRKRHGAGEDLHQSQIMDLMKPTRDQVKNHNSIAKDGINKYLETKKIKAPVKPTSTSNIPQNAMIGDGDTGYYVQGNVAATTEAMGIYNTQNNLYKQKQESNNNSEYAEYYKKAEKQLKNLGKGTSEEEIGAQAMTLATQDMRAKHIQREIRKEREKQSKTVDGNILLSDEQKEADKKTEDYYKQIAIGEDASGKPVYGPKLQSSIKETTITEGMLTGNSIDITDQKRVIDSNNKFWRNEFSSVEKELKEYSSVPATISTLNDLNEQVKKYSDSAEDGGLPPDKYDEYTGLVNKYNEIYSNSKGDIDAYVKLQKKYQDINFDYNSSETKNGKIATDKLLGNYNSLIQNQSDLYKTYQFQINDQNGMIEDNADMGAYLEVMGKNHNNIAQLGGILTNGVIELGMTVETVKHQLNPRTLIADGLKEYYKGDPDSAPDMVKGLLAANDYQNVPREKIRKAIGGVQDYLTGSLQQRIEWKDLGDGVDDTYEWGEYVLGAAADFVPQLALMTAAPHASLYILASSAGGGKYEQLKEENQHGGDYSMAQMYFASALTGVVEYGTEKVTLGLLNKTGPGLEAIRNEGWKNGIKNLFNPKNIGRGLYDVGSESTSEVFAKIGENFADKMIGKDVSILDGIDEAAFNGLVMSGIMKSPVAFKQVVSPFMRPEDSYILEQVDAEILEIEKQLNNKDLSEENRGLLESQLDALVTKSGKVMHRIIDNADEMTAEEFKIIQNADVSLNETKATIRNIKNDESSGMSQADKDKLIKQVLSDHYETNKQKNEVLKEINLRNDVKTAEKAFKKLNPNSKFETIDTRNQFQKRYEEITGEKDDVRNTDAFFDPISGDAYINKTRAKEVGAVSAGSHELLHRIMKNVLNGADGKLTKEGKGLIDSFLNNIPAKHRAIIQKRIDDNYKFAKYEIVDGVRQGVGAEKNPMEYYEEYLNSYSDAIRKKEINPKDGDLLGVGRKIRDFFSETGYENLEFSNGRDVKNFIKDYTADIKSGEVRESILAVGEGDGAQIGDVKFSESAFEDAGVVDDLGLKNNTADIVRKNNKIEEAILREGVKDKDGNVIASPNMQRALAENNLPRAFALARQAANKGNDLTLEEGLKMNDVMEFFSEYSLKLTELARTYKAEMKDPKTGKTIKVPFGAYMNSLLPLKYSGILNKLKNKVQASSMSEEATAKEVGRISTPSAELASNEVEGKKVALETIGEQATQEQLVNIAKGDPSLSKLRRYKDVKTRLVKHRKFIGVKNSKGEVIDKIEITPELKAQYKKDGKKPPEELKSLRDPFNKDGSYVDPLYAGLEAVSAIFSVDPLRIIREQDLDTTQRKSSQDAILAKTNEIIDMMPFGTTASGDATGIANTTLGIFYKKLGRTSMRATGTGKGLAKQQKQNIDPTKFRALVGLVKGGRINNTSVDGAIRAVVVQVASIAANQAVRQTYGPETLPLKDGKASAMFSETYQAPFLQEIGELSRAMQKEQGSWPSILKRFGLTPIDMMTENGRHEMELWAFGTANQYLPLIFFQHSGNWTGTTAGALEADGTEIRLHKGNYLYKNTKELNEAIDYYIQDGRMWQGEAMSEQDKADIAMALKRESLSDKTLKNEEAKRSKERGFELIWKQFEKMVEDNPNNLPYIAALLSSSSAYQGHFMRTGSTYEFKNLEDGATVEEHQQPATDLAKFLFNRLAQKNLFEGDTFKNAVAGYQQGKLLKIDDKKLINKKKDWSYQSNAGEYMYPIFAGIMPIWVRYFNPKVNGNNGGINPNSYKLANGNTIAQEYGVNVDTKLTNPVVIAKQQDLLYQIFTGQITQAQAAKTINSVANAKFSSTIEADKTLDKAMKFSSTVNTPRGITVLDFDDTLATTKSGVRYTLPNPDGTPQPKKKVIFMAGGPGSGKSNVINQLGLKGQGFKVVNQDISLEWLMKNHGMPTDMREFTPEQASEFGKLSHEARGIALKKRIKYQGEGDGVIIDGTGASLNVMKKNIQDFKDKGYDVQMVFVETSQETALSRNKARKERSLRTGIVIKTHDSVQANKEAYKELFGERFAEVNTDNLKQGDAMPADVVNKVNDFTSGYIKGRLNAGEYATKGEELKQQGAEFDFSEFNQVVEGKTAPLFNKAMKLQEKFTSKDMFVLTARPAESNQAIFEFLQANGLNIPIENIVGLGSSLSSDKALWMAGKVGEGYNDFYFADDILENVKAVSDMLEQFDVKSKVQQAKRDFVLGDPKVTKLLDEKYMNDVKDVDSLANPGTYNNIKFSKSHRAEYENTVAKNRPDLSGKEVTATIDKMFEYIDSLDVPNKRKYEQITTKWLATSNIKLPEDSYKIQQAVEIAELKKEDIFSYKNPNEIIEKYAGTIKVKPISPVGIKEFTRATGFNDPITTEYGIVEYEVEETREAQQKVRDIVNTHWGPNSNPWCITKIDKDGNLSEDAWRDWTSYGKGPKRIVFQNGKLLAMKANYEYWGKMNKHSEGPIIQIKEGNVTNTTELVVGGGGIVNPIIKETRTASKDGNTVTTNIFEDSQDGYADGTTIVENRIKGVKTKETRFDPDGSKVNTQEFNKKGKPTTSYQFNPNGKVKSVNGHLQQQAITEAGLDVNAREDADIDLTNELVVRVGDIIENNYTETETDGTTTDYFYGRALVGDQVMEIGFESKTGLDLADVTKTIDGKTRLDIGKVIREVDPDVKGLPKTGVKFSKGISKEFNDIIEQSTGVGSEKVFSNAQAKIRGNKKRFDNIVPYSVQDLMGLLYNFVGKGKVGEQQMEFFKKALIDPFGRAINELNKSKQNSASDYSNLTKAFTDVKKKLNKEVEGGDYTYDQAIRVYLWNKAGFEVPGLSKRDLNALDSIVKNDPELQAFADALGLISKKEEGYAKPGEYWLVENIASDLLSDGSIGDARSEFLAEWQQNADEMFSKENLNKIQAIYGNKFREALEDILYRMKHGTNRPTGSSRLTNNFMNWINNSTGAIMFFNMRSALLQTLSTTNYINWTDNNPLKAAMAFADQKQYWSDFSALFNSDFLKQRRSGNQRSINEAELTAAVANSDNKAKAALAWLLQKGFLPTQIMDSFAISAGGATFYRNRVNKYIKEGMTPEQAQEKAFLDFQEITEATQQSARPDMISQQQASPLGRLILSFQNTPMQYARIMNKAARDIVNGRGDQKSNISKIVYYGALQSIIFAALQSAIFAALGDDEEEEFDKKKQRIVGSMVDGWLAGLGVAGKAIGTIERSIKEYLKQKERGFNADHAQTIIQLLGFSPPIGSKLRKIYSAIQTEEFNKGVSEKRGFTLDNPTWSSWGNVIEGFTNIPLGRISNKLLNIDNALDSQNQWWERAALLLGWNTWDLGIKDPDITAVKGEIKEERKVEKKKEAVIKKEEKKQEIKEENVSKEKANIELQKKEIEAGNESPDCAAINKRGERCGTKIEKGSVYCTIHTKVEQSDGGKKTQCGKTKENGKRCKMQTSNKSGYCYYHD
jgi:hypothetical protein